MKKYYEPLEMEITKFTAAPDCITTSVGTDLGDGDTGEFPENNPSNANYLAEF